MSDDPTTHGARTIDDEGRVRLPDDALDRLDLEPGDDMRVFDTGEEVVLLPWTREAIREMADEE